VVLSARDGSVDHWHPATRRSRCAAPG